MKNIEMFKFYRAIILLLILNSFFFSCDFIAAGSNLMAERYKFEVSKDSLMHRIILFNVSQDSESQDYIFKIDKNSPYFYKGYIYDNKNSESYLVLIPTPSESDTELLLISITDREGQVIGINHEPENKEEIKVRKTVIKNFEDRILNNLNLKYVRLGNAMNKNY
ncbi:hypothetical protein [Sphingobacterium sp. DR205]|uniref:hypothetical protein n=1 Tax=Sphingobacterium sp. DR205 TaxID=2713573 RepID=UPI0013E4674B|nr:hypothetical protein [Sphingobacterium sp. DR205]QIH34164.1 hypothetical protein G6053_15265 [Sphingobacterium sp. DR205]